MPTPPLLSFSSCTGGSSTTPATKEKTRLTFTAPGSGHYQARYNIKIFDERHHTGNTIWTHTGSDGATRVDTFRYETRYSEDSAAVIAEEFYNKHNGLSSIVNFTYTSPNTYVDLEAKEAGKGARFYTDVSNTLSYSKDPRALVPVYEQVSGDDYPTSNVTFYSPGIEVPPLPLQGKLQLITTNRFKGMTGDITFPHEFNEWNSSTSVLVPKPNSVYGFWLRGGGFTTPNNVHGADGGLPEMANKMDDGMFLGYLNFTYDNAGNFAPGNYYIGMSYYDKYNQDSGVVLASEDFDVGNIDYVAQDSTDSDRSLRINFLLNAYRYDDDDGSTYMFDERIYGINLWIKKEGEGNWYHLFDANFELGIKTWDGDDYTPWASDTNVSDLATNIISHGGTMVEENIIIYEFPEETYYDKYSYNGSENIRVRYNESTLCGRKNVVGNIDITDENGLIIESKPSVMVVSPVGRYDILPETGHIEASFDNPGPITALESEGDNVYQFRQNHLYIINVSNRALPFIYGEFPGNGVVHRNDVCKLKNGIAWVNKSGIWTIGLEGQINWLTYDRISTYDWETNFYKPVGVFSGATDLEARRELVYIEKDNKLLYFSDISGPDKSLSCDLDSGQISIGTKMNIYDCTNFTTTREGEVIVKNNFASGTHQDTNDSSTPDKMQDNDASFPIAIPGSLVGSTITNVTDGSTATITANTQTTISGNLEGGTDNSWDANDAYTVKLTGFQYFKDIASHPAADITFRTKNYDMENPTFPKNFKSVYLTYEGQGQYYEDDFNNATDGYAFKLFARCIPLDGTENTAWVDLGALPGSSPQPLTSRFDLKTNALDVSNGKKVGAIEFKIEGTNHSNLLNKHYVPETFKILDYAITYDELGAR